MSAGLVCGVRHSLGGAWGLGVRRGGDPSLNGIMFLPRSLVPGISSHLLSRTHPLASRVRRAVRQTSERSAGCFVSWNINKSLLEEINTENVSESGSLRSDLAKFSGCQMTQWVPPCSFIQLPSQGLEAGKAAVTEANFKSEFG